MGSHRNRLSAPQTFGCERAEDADVLLARALTSLGRALSELHAVVTTITECRTLGHDTHQRFAAGRYADVACAELAALVPARLSDYRRPTHTAQK